MLELTNNGVLLARSQKSPDANNHNDQYKGHLCQPRPGLHGRQEPTWTAERVRGDKWGGGSCMKKRSWEKFGRLSPKKVHEDRSFVLREGGRTDRHRLLHKRRSITFGRRLEAHTIYHHGAASIHAVFGSVEGLSCGWAIRERDSQGSCGRDCCRGCSAAGELPLRWTRQGDRRCAEVNEALVKCMRVFIRPPRWLLPSTS